MISFSSGLRLRRLRLRSIFFQSANYRRYQICPAVWFSRLVPSANSIQRLPSTRRVHSTPEISPRSKLQVLAAAYLPTSCPGCGSLTQWVETSEPGFYNAQRRSVKTFLREVAPQGALDEEGKASSQEGEDSVTTIEEPPEKTEQKDNTQPKGEEADEVKPPFCDRCHNLINHRDAVSVHSPSIHSLRDIISESPFKHNHVYHVLDAADFPLSLIPNIYRDLDLQSQRSKNRRSKVVEFEGGTRRTSIHFVITRSDLLAPLKEQVDTLMAPIVEILRDAVGTRGQNIRMGNVHLVSAHRGWWTKNVKEKIWEHGGAVWLVGKTNVGKSNLIETIFPKATAELQSGKQTQTTIKPGANQTIVKPERTLDSAEASDDTDVSDVNSLLPPAQQEARFPVLPIVSPLSGTTASPIRIPFGGRRGELIDLPGLSRGGLEEFAQKDQQLDLIMKKRIKPERMTVKPGKSLLFGGLVRITPTSPWEDIVLAASFTPIPPHVTSTEKAVGMQIQERVSNIPTVAKDGVGHTIASAGVFELKWDVTNVYGEKQRDSGRRGARGKEQRPFPLLYKVMATDILIEGCGWVELTAQVRTKGLEDRELPKVEVFSPGGKHIGTRMPLNAWAFLSGDKRLKDQNAKKRLSKKKK